MIFWKQNIHQNLFLYKSIPLQNLMRCKTFFFRNMTSSKTFDSKFFELWKNGSGSKAFETLDSKSDALLKHCFKIWFFSKVSIGDMFFLLWFYDFYQLVAFGKANRCKNWRFQGLKRSKIGFLKANIHQILFLYKSVSVQNMMRCKTFFPKSDMF